MEISREKVLLLNIKQPFAHYREPKIMQDDYIPTLNLPPATTIAGMISYLIDRKLKTEFKIGVVGTYKDKTMEFIRGEFADFFSGYEKFILNKEKNYKNSKLQEKFNVWEFYNYYKKLPKGKNKVTNRIMHFEILQDIELKIFLSTKNNDLIKNALEKPGKYLSLGRKEDFIISKDKNKKIVEEVEIETIFLENKKEAIKNNLIFKNTYVPVKLRDRNYENIIREGILYSLPQRYRDLQGEKKDRVMEYKNYVYLGKEGAYLQNVEANIYKFKNKNDDYENVVFSWL